MRSVIVFLCMFAFLHAGVFDFLDVAKAKKSYENRDYKTAIQAYKKIEDKQGATYDLANSYYKNKEYQKALNKYQKVTDKNLEFQKLYNMGNTYAHLGKIDDAIKSYENALKIKKDKDTQFNLDLLKKQKKKQQKQQKQQNKNKKQNKKQDSKQNNQNKNSKSKKQTKKDQQKQTKQEKQKQRPKDQQQNEKQNTSKTKQEKQKPSPRSIKKEPPISDMEERKYQKMLNQRGINTLMLPIKSKGESNHEENPW